MNPSLENEKVRADKKCNVFVVQDPQGKNIAPACDFGEIHIILRGNESHGQAVNKFDAAFRKLSEDDYILLIGNPIFIGMAFYLAQLRLGDRPMQILVWDRMHFKYNVERIELFI